MQTATGKRLRDIECKHKHYKSNMRKQYLKSQNVEASTILSFAKKNGFNVKEKRVEKFFSVNGDKHCKAAKQVTELAKCAPIEEQK